jgi:hypothetical protein
MVTTTAAAADVILAAAYLYDSVQIETVQAAVTGFTC